MQLQSGQKLLIEQKMLQKLYIKLKTDETNKLASEVLFLYKDCLYRVIAIFPPSFVYTDNAKTLSIHHYFSNCMTSPLLCC